MVHSVNRTKLVGNDEFSQVFTRRAVTCSKMLEHFVKRVQFARISYRFPGRSILSSLPEICGWTENAGLENEGPTEPIWKCASLQFHTAVSVLQRTLEVHRVAFVFTRRYRCPSYSYTKLARTFVILFTVIPSITHNYFQKFFKHANTASKCCDECRLTADQGRN